MRIRLDLVRSWQSEYDRPYFYAGPGRGADIASWRQAARAELAASSHQLDYANAMLDLVKAFERVPHDWLAHYAHEYSYPVFVLRLCISAYRLGRVVLVCGVVSNVIFASRGITAGAVHATTELRLLLIRIMDDISYRVPFLIITLYVDDSSFEAVGSKKVVIAAVSKAVQLFANAMCSVGMELSPTKNVCLASSSGIAQAIIAKCPGLDIGATRATKSLGGGIGTGKTRSVGVLAKRLKQFRARRARFRKARRIAGASAVNRVLRTGGTSALVYGQGNMGVAPSMLHSQRVAVAAASARAGSGDLDLTLALADGSCKGEADPCFEAHKQPIGKWAQAVWYNWLPLAALNAILRDAKHRLSSTAHVWRRVFGPGAAFLASAWRIGWTLTSATDFTDELGVPHDLTCETPAFVATLVHRAVSTWRWRRVEAKHPHLRQKDGGFGPFIQPIFKLLRPKDSEGWGPRERGALRSAFTGRQWPQARLCQAKRVTHPACRLCVATGRCADDDCTPQFAGTLLHRVLSCPATQPFRDELAPGWIKTLSERFVRQGYSLPPAEAVLVTRALAPSPAALIDDPPAEATFRWIVPPPEEGLPAGSTLYADGSRLFAEHKYFGMAARHGWAVVALNAQGRFVASASGVPPSWADGIFGAELWGLWQALRISGPGEQYRVDCLSVSTGVQKGIDWATSGDRKLGRLWGWVGEAFEGRTDDVAWMPAHVGDKSVGHRTLSNGQSLTPVDVAANDYVDGKAKAEARAIQPPRSQLWAIVLRSIRLNEAALWLGRITALANRFPIDGPDGKKRYIRDSDGVAVKSSRARKAKVLPSVQRLPSSMVTMQGVSDRCRTHPRITAVWGHPQTASSTSPVAGSSSDCTGEPPASGGSAAVSDALSVMASLPSAGPLGVVEDACLPPTPARNCILSAPTRLDCFARRPVRARASSCPPADLDALLRLSGPSSGGLLASGPGRSRTCSKTDVSPRSGRAASLDVCPGSAGADVS